MTSTLRFELLGTPDGWEITGICVAFDGRTGWADQRHWDGRATRGMRQFALAALRLDGRLGGQDVSRPLVDAPDHGEAEREIAKGLCSKLLESTRGDPRVGWPHELFGDDLARWGRFFAASRSGGRASVSLVPGAQIEAKLNGRIITPHEWTAILIAAGLMDPDEAGGLAELAGVADMMRHSATVSADPGWASLKEGVSGWSGSRDGMKAWCEAHMHVLNMLEHMAADFARGSEPARLWAYEQSQAHLQRGLWDRLAEIIDAVESREFFPHLSQLPHRLRAFGTPEDASG